MKNKAIAVVSSVVLSFQFCGLLCAKEEHDSIPAVSQYKALLQNPERTQRTLSDFFASEPELKDRSRSPGQALALFVSLLADQPASIASALGVDAADASGIKTRAIQVYAILAGASVPNAATTAHLRAASQNISGRLDSLERTDFNAGTNANLDPGGAAQPVPARNRRSEHIRDDDDSRNNGYTHPYIALLGGVGSTKADTYGADYAKSSILPKGGVVICDSGGNLAVGAIGGCGDSHHVEFATGGFMGRIPLLAKTNKNKLSEEQKRDKNNIHKTNKYGNLGLELGLIVSRYGKKDKGIDFQTSAHLTPGDIPVSGDFHDDYHLTWSRHAFDMLEFAGISYQTPTFLKFLSAEVGMRLAGFSSDTHFSLNESITHTVFIGFVTCTDSKGNPIPGSSCANWQTTTLQQRSVDVPGSRYVGLGGVPFVSVTAAIAKHCAFKIEKVKALAPGVDAKGLRGGLVITF